MHVISNENLASILKGKNIYLDNDFLNRLLKDKEFAIDFFNISIDGFLKIDPLVEFEFLCGTINPKQIKSQKDLIYGKAFKQVENDQDSLIKENAILLTKIYKLQNLEADLVDFFLAARVMTSYKNSLLITGNKKHFSSSIFDIEGVINTEHPNKDSISAFPILKFNNEKFSFSFNRLSSISKVKIRTRFNLMDF